MWTKLYAEDASQLMYYKESAIWSDFPRGYNEPCNVTGLLQQQVSANHGMPMIPFYIYYSMFGFNGQAIYGLLVICARGFIIGGTAGAYHFKW